MVTVERDDGHLQLEPVEHLVGDLPDRAVVDDDHVAEAQLAPLALPLRLLEVLRPGGGHRGREPSLDLLVRNDQLHDAHRERQRATDRGQLLVGPHRAGEHDVIHAGRQVVADHGLEVRHGDGVAPVMIEPAAGGVVPAEPVEVDRAVRHPRRFQDSRQLLAQRGLAAAVGPDDQHPVRHVDDLLGGRQTTRQHRPVRRTRLSPARQARLVVPGHGTAGLPADWRELHAERQRLDRRQHAGRVRGGSRWSRVLGRRSPRRPLPRRQPHRREDQPRVARQRRHRRARREGRHQRRRRHRLRERA